MRRAISMFPLLSRVARMAVVMTSTSLIDTDDPHCAKQLQHIATQAKKNYNQMSGHSFGYVRSLKTLPDLHRLHPVWVSFRNFWLIHNYIYH